MEELKQDRDQLIAESKDYYLKHQNDWWKIPDKVKTALSDVRQARLEENVYEEKIFEWLENNSKEETWWEDVADECLGLPVEKWTRPIQMQVADALRRLGWTKGSQKRLNDVKGKRIVPWRKPSTPGYTVVSEGIDGATYLV